MSWLLRYSYTTKTQRYFELKTQITTVQVKCEWSSSKSQQIKFIFILHTEFNHFNDSLLAIHAQLVIPVKVHVVKNKSEEMSEK